MSEMAFESRKLKGTESFEWVLVGKGRKNKGGLQRGCCSLSLGQTWLGRSWRQPAWSWLPEPELGVHLVAWLCTDFVIFSAFPSQSSASPLLPAACCSAAASAPSLALLLATAAAGTAEQKRSGSCFGIPSNRVTDTGSWISGPELLADHAPSTCANTEPALVVLGSPLVPEPGFYLQNCEITMKRVHAIQQSNNVAKE